MNLIYTCIFFFIYPLFTQAQKLELISRTELPNGLQFQSTVVGGLSGLTADGKNYFIVSDDKGKISPPRFYHIQLNSEKNNKNWSIQFLNTVKIQKKDISQNFKPITADLEGIQYHKDQFLILSDEGNSSSKPRRAPNLQTYSLDGYLQNQIEVPTDYIPEETGEQKRGVQDNAGFEGLSLTPSQQILYAAIERNLVQDKIGPRIAIFDYQKNKQFAFKKDCFYPIESSDYQSGEVVKGISEIISLDENRIIVLERGIGFVNLSPTYFVKFYLVNMLECQKGKETLSKKMIFNLNEWNNLQPTGQIIQNFEAMAWLNTDNTSQRTLIIVSDDNFKQREKTEFLFFKFSE